MFSTDWITALRLHFRFSLSPTLSTFATFARMKLTRCHTLHLVFGLTLAAGGFIGCGGSGGESESSPAVQTPLNPGVDATERRAIEAGVYNAAEVVAVAAIAGYPLQQLSSPSAAIQNSNGSFGSCPEVKLAGVGTPLKATLTFPNCTPAGTAQVIDGAANLTVAQTGEHSLTVGMLLAGLTIDGNPTTGDISGDLTVNGDPRSAGSSLAGILSLAELSFSRSGVNYSAQGIVQLGFVFSGDAARPVQRIEVGTATINSNAGGTAYVINAADLAIDPARGNIPSSGKVIVTEPGTGDTGIGAPRTTVIEFNNLSPNTGVVEVTVTEGGDSRSFEYDLLP